MKSKYNPRFILLIFIFCISSIINPTRASHNAGGELTYRHLAGNHYLIQCTFYRDCFGIPAPTSILCEVVSVSCAYSQGYSMPSIPGTGQEITYLCPSATSTCNGGMTPGIQKYQYEVEVLLPGQCADWQFIVTDCCRNGAITTISVPAGQGIYLEARLDNSTGDNSSAQFTHDPILFSCIGQDIIFNNGLIDPDGDSLVYSLAPARIDQNTNVTYLAGYSALQPLSSVPQITLDPVSGNLFMHPVIAEVGVIVYNIDEYRAGVLISRVMRDVQMYTVTCSNQLPNLTGLNGTGQMSTYILPGVSSCFHIFSYDPDGGDTLTMIWNNAISQASFSAMGNPYPTGTFCWTPTLNDVRVQPYDFTVTVLDNNCPTNGAAVYNYSITVTLDSSLVTPINPHGYFSGNVFYDLNSDGLKDTTELNFPNQRINVSPDGISIYSNTLGTYLFYSLANSQHQIDLQLHNDWNITSTSPFFSVTDDSLDQTGFDFGINATNIYNQIEINFAGGTPRCSDIVLYWLNYQNTGTKLSDGRVIFILDQACTFISSTPAPDLIIGDSLFYNYLNLMPYAYNQVVLQLFLPAGGDTIIFNGTTEYDSSGIYYTSDVQLLQQVVRCSCDPNAKTVFPEGITADHLTLYTEPLLYTIYFQNSGTDTAFTVFIQDYIDAALDLSTFHITGSSHLMNPTIYPNRMVEFRFENILLPDSGTNEMESHGYVQFEIFPKTNLSLPVVAENNAHIFFDSNFPVTTNTVSNTLVSEFSVSVKNPSSKAAFAIVVPNPFHNEAEIILGDSFRDSESFIRVMNVWGELVLTQSITQPSVKISRGILTQGIYFYEVKNKSEIFVGKFVIN
ncbi:hypothetical protein BH11BAC1_BH11BAC1_18070 [soil metagenome]